MPIFDFVCTECESREERLVSRDAVESQVCKSCKKPMVRSDDIYPMQFALKGVWFKSHKRY